MISASTTNSSLNEEFDQIPHGKELHEDVFCGVNEELDQIPDGKELHEDVCCGVNEELDQIPHGKELHEDVFCGVNEELDQIPHGKELHEDVFCGGLCTVDDDGLDSKEETGSDGDGFSQDDESQGASSSPTTISCDALDQLEPILAHDALPSPTHHDGLPSPIDTHTPYTWPIGSIPPPREVVRSPSPEVYVESPYDNDDVTLDNSDLSTDFVDMDQMALSLTDLPSGFYLIPNFVMPEQLEALGWDVDAATYDQSYVPEAYDEEILYMNDTTPYTVDSACADVELPLGVLDFKDMCAANTMYATNYDPEYGYMQYMGQPAMYYRQPSDGKTSGGKYQQKDKSRDIDRGGTTYRSQAHNWHSDRPGQTRHTERDRFGQRNSGWAQEYQRRQQHNAQVEEAMKHKPRDWNRESGWWFGEGYKNDKNKRGSQDSESVAESP